MVQVCRNPPPDTGEHTGGVTSILDPRMHWVAIRWRGDDTKPIVTDVAVYTHMESHCSSQIYCVISPFV